MAKILILSIFNIFLKVVDFYIYVKTRRISVLRIFWENFLNFGDKLKSQNIKFTLEF